MLKGIVFGERHILQNIEAPKVFLEWLPEFELGIPEIDNQHRGLRDLVNVVAESIMAGDNVAAHAAITQLLHHSNAHFDFEEGLMRQLGYPGNALHHEQHSELLGSMARLQAEVASSRFSINRTRALHFMRDWFSIHIVRTDGDFARFIREQESAWQSGRIQASAG